MKIQTKISSRAIGCFTSLWLVMALPFAHKANGDEGVKACNAKLIVSSPQIHLNEPIEYTIEIKNNSAKSVSILDPHFVEMMPFLTSQVKLLVFDSNGNQIDDLRQRYFGSVVSACWIVLPPGAVLAVKKAANARMVSRGLEHLTPGKYRLQLLFLDTFVSEEPYADLPMVKLAANGQLDPDYAERWEKWQQKHPGKELFRSNIVDITIVQDK